MSACCSAWIRLYPYCFNPLKDVIRGKRLVVVDDTIVRGNTQRALVRMLREAGAAEVHIRITAPPVKWPCFYGIDFASRAELIANGLGVEEIARSLGADSLGYLSEEGMITATEQPASQLCTACFSGRYPIELPPSERSASTCWSRTSCRWASPRTGCSASSRRPVARPRWSARERPAARARTRPRASTRRRGTRPSSS